MVIMFSVFFYAGTNCNFNGGSILPFPVSSLGDAGCFIRTSRGLIARSALKPISRVDGATTGDEFLATDRGARVGVLFVPTVQNADLAEMHFIVNGEDQGPCSRDIPYKEGALHAVIDVYGSTKQVRVIQLYGSECCCGFVVLRKRDEAGTFIFHFFFSKITAERQSRCDFDEDQTRGCRSAAVAATTQRLFAKILRLNARQHLQHTKYLRTNHTSNSNQLSFKHLR